MLRRTLSWFPHFQGFHNTFRDYPASSPWSLIILSLNILYFVQANQQVAPFAIRFYEDFECAVTVVCSS